MPGYCGSSGAAGRGPRRLPSIQLADAPPTTVVGPSDEDDAAGDSATRSASGRTGSETGLRPPRRDYLKTARLSVTRLNDYLRRLPSARQRKDRNATKRERKATKTLAIVLGLYIDCEIASLGVVTTLESFSISSIL